MLRLKQRQEYKNTNKNKKMTRIIETVIAWVSAIILPAQIYLMLIGGFIFINLIFNLILKYRGVEKGTIKEIFMKSIKSVAIYSIALLGIFHLDTAIINQVMLGIFPSIDLFATKLTTILFLTPEGAELNGNIKKLTGLSIVERLKILIKNITTLKKHYDEIKKDQTEEDGTN